MHIIKKHVTVRKRFGSDRMRTDTRGVVWHYTQHPMQSPLGAYEYFNDPTKTAYSGCQYCIGFDGKIYEFAEPDRATWHCGSSKGYSDLMHERFPEYTTNEPRKTPNWIFCGVEVCHKTVTGEWTVEAMDSAIALGRYLNDRYDLEERDNYRHFDITGKPCPLNMVENPNVWAAFKRQIESKKNGSVS